MSTHVIEYSKKGLTFSALTAPPMSLTTGLIPRLGNQPLSRAIIIIRLHVVTREVARPPQVAGKGLHPVRNREGRSHLVRPQTDRRHSRDQAGPRRGADWCCRESTGVTHALLRKPVQVWSSRELIAIAPKIRTHILRCDP